MTTTLTEGDVFFWSWRDLERSHHCYSRIAIVKDGRLIDTYWGDMSSDRAIDPEKADLEFKGNLATLEEINPWRARYYRREDVVDMRHANSDRAPVYVKPGAQRDPEVMRELGRYMIERAESEINMARYRIESIEKSLRCIDAGDLQSVEFPAA